MPGTVWGVSHADILTFIVTFSLITKVVPFYFKSVQSVWFSKRKKIKSPTILLFRGNHSKYFVYNLKLLGGGGGGWSIQNRFIYMNSGVG